jgi:hypothetical protein
VKPAASVCKIGVKMEAAGSPATSIPIYKQHSVASQKIIISTLPLFCFESWLMFISKQKKVTYVT